MRLSWCCGLPALLLAGAVGAQPIPARDLLEFPLGAVLEPAALAVESGSGLWNPATAVLRKTERWRFGVAAITTQQDQGIGSQLMSVAYRRPTGYTFAGSVARAAVANILRTDTDPQSVGEVPYNSLLVSGSVSRDVLPRVSVGVAARWRQGSAEREVRHAVAADLGIVVHDLPWRNGRFAASSFLWRPGREIDDRPALLVAFDARVAGTTARDVRLGASYNGVNRGAKESGIFSALNLDVLEARASFLRTSLGGRSVSRVRYGFALRFAQYVVGIAREEGVSGLGPLYQYSLSSTLR